MIKNSLLSFVLFAIHPILSISHGIYFYIKKKRTVFLALSIIGFISLIHTTQKATGLDRTDIVNYYDLHRQVSDTQIKLKSVYSFNTLLKIGNYFFNDDMRPFIFFVIFFIFLSTYLISKKDFVQEKSVYITIFLLLGVLNFVQAGELLKQNLGMITFLWSLYLFDKNKVFSLLLVPIGIGFHPANAVLFTLLIISMNIRVLKFSSFFFILGSFVNHNKLFIKKVCEVSITQIGCSKIEFYESLPWQISPKEHLSVFGLMGIALAFYIIRKSKVKKLELDHFDKFYIAYYLMLIFSLKTPHTFIRFLNAGFPVIALIYVRAISFINFKIDKEKAALMFFCTCFFYYNYKATKQRITRKTYQTSYMERSYLNLLMWPTYRYFSGQYKEPWTRLKVH